jgi:TolA-binding protein
MTPLARTLVKTLMPVLAATMAAPLLVPAVARAEAAAPAGETTEARMRRIEGELRALQRKVFPDGAGRTFAAEIVPDNSATVAPAPSGNAPAISDLMSRMDAVEAQMKALTASSEDSQNRLNTLEGRVAAVESAQAAAPATQPAASGLAAKPDDKAPAAPAALTPSTPAAADRAAAIAAIERPVSDDKGEDAYTYGYRLWEAKFLPESQSVLLDFVQRYPKHKRISYARNLLGRAYLDDNKPGAAAQWFVQNYQADKAGDRAADSLLYLAVAMTRLKEVKRACIALGEFRQTYPAESDGRLKGQYDAVTKTVACH